MRSIPAHWFSRGIPSFVFCTYMHSYRSDWTKNTIMKLDKRTLLRSVLYLVLLVGCCPPFLTAVGESPTCTTESCAASGCDCRPGYKEVTIVQCQKVLGSTCTINTDCNDVANANCNQNGGSQTCQCIQGYQADVDMLSCQKVLGRTCKSDTECNGVPNSVCAGQEGNRTCQCKGGYKTDSSQLTCQTVLGNHCLNDEDCISIVNATCAGAGGSKTCQCIPGYSVAVDGASCKESGKPTPSYCSHQLPAVFWIVIMVIVSLLI